MTSEFGGFPPDPFDADYLKSLPPAALSEVLLDEAFAALTQLPEKERDITTDLVMNICRVPSESEQMMFERHTALQEELGQDVGLARPETSAEFRTELRENAAKIIDRLKRHIESGLQSGEAGGWTEMHTKNALVSICNERVRAGISGSEAYVRETALESLSSLGYRGVVLLQNAITGDNPSYEPGLETVQQAVRDEELGLVEAGELMEQVLEFMSQQGPAEPPILSDLAIELLGYLRSWNDPAFSETTARYAIYAARLAAIVRERD